MGSSFPWPASWKWKISIDFHFNEVSWKISMKFQRTTHYGWRSTYPMCTTVTDPMGPESVHLLSVHLKKPRWTLGGHVKCPPSPCSSVNSSIIHSWLGFFTTGHFSSAGNRRLKIWRFPQIHLVAEFQVNCSHQNLGWASRVYVWFGNKHL